MNKFLKIARVKKSFTLIEAMIVVFIIAIIAGLAVPSFYNAVEEAKFKEAKAVLMSIRGAEKIFKAEYGNFVGVDINAAAAAKTANWALLNIEVIDTTNWSYGADWGCGCSPGGAAGNDPDNVAIIPFARREQGVEAGRFMYVRITDGLIRGTANDPRPGQLINGSICSQVGGNCAFQR
ncbi:MAG: hypothetical protein COV72_00740 [Candidatus Omnitrophica bacterium CG11_big_fil_rev_8_21_14_0_20_42_13]|uniref:Prepilin-type N-terminal cleavage/methylation domain-containing protein n=1 Tax=Candidatus Ghiorseimicrobium undicola TaxID=1974746 RepID=A0A2H0M299_9BACT|nr:MAG: hypothetical protein COV72_00740 [Candidatus Omnitrophica bacterium CG11_big_fil_rev_8_21_14_0_20_42_13]